MRNKVKERDRNNDMITMMKIPDPEGLASTS